MGLLEVRNGKIIETRIIESDTEQMTDEECRAYTQKLEEEIQELRKAGK